MKDKNIVKAVLCALGITMGVMLIFKGVEIDSLVGDLKFYPSEYGGSLTRLPAMEFGADYYTESYKAMAFGANVESGTFQMLHKTVTALLTFGGTAISCGFGVGLCSALGIGNKKPNSSNEADAEPAQPTAEAAAEPVAPAAAEPECTESLAAEAGTAEPESAAAEAQEPEPSKPANDATPASEPAAEA